MFSQDMSCFDVLAILADFYKMMKIEWFSKKKKTAGKNQLYSKDGRKTG